MMRTTGAQVTRQLAIASGLAGPARRLREVFPTAGMKRDRRDNEHLRVVPATALDHARHRPVVVFEHGVGAADYDGTRPEQVHELLVERAGLRLFDLDGNGPLGRDEFAESFAQAEIWNYLARR
jgi:hypothetical protein